MKAALIARGIPESIIYCDYAGFSTLDSMIRAARVFGQEQLIIVSQRFHNERAIYIARHYGIDAHGFNAKDVGLRAGLKTQVREKAARVKTILDLHVLATGPKFLGPRIDIGSNESPPLFRTKS